APADVSDADLARAMGALVGESLQRPPAYSAVKVGGRKLYDAARAGEALEAPPRPIRVDRFAVTGRRGPAVDFVPGVGPGAYVRVLAADVGAALGCGAHLTALRRTSIGSFSVEDASPPAAPGEILPLEAAVAHLPHVTLVEDEARVARHGSILGPAGLAGPYAAVGPGGSLVGVYRGDGPEARPEMILAASE